MPNLIGYARVSTAEQDPQLQLDALAQAGVARVFTETASAARRERPKLQEALDYLNPGDTFVVYRLDRMARSTADAVAILAQQPDPLEVVLACLPATGPPAFAERGCLRPAIAHQKQRGALLIGAVLVGA